MISQPQVTETRRSVPWPALFIAVELALGGASIALGSGWPASLLHDVAGLAATLAIVAGIVRYRAKLRSAWTLVAVAVGAFGAGDVAYELDATGEGVKIFAPGDWLYLFAMVTLAVALALFGTGPRRSARARRLSLVDSLPVFLGSFLVMWFFVFDGAFDGLGQSLSERALVVLYPTFDLLMLALAARLLLTGAARLPSFALLTAGIGFGFLGDLVWRGFLQESSYANVWVRGSYYLAYAFLGAAGLHRSMCRLGELEFAEGEVMAGRRLPLLGGALATVPLVVLVGHQRIGGSEDLVIFGTAAILIPAAVVYRLIDLVHFGRRLALASEAAASRLEAVLDASPLPIAVIGAGGEIQRWNNAAEGVTGWTAEEVLGRRWRLEPAPGERRAESVRRRALRGERLDHVELALRRRDGDPRLVELSTAPVGSRDLPQAVVAVFVDVTDERKHQDEIRYLAEHDALTGLLNRRRFAERLAEEATAAAAGGTSSLVAIADLDSFKLVNDSAGHHVGDGVLRDVAGLFASQLRPQDVCARLSGDEFAFLLPGCSREEGFDVAERLLQAVRDYRLPVEGGSIAITTSIGLCPIHPGRDPLALVEQAMIGADTALYEAKVRGRNRASIWSPALAQTHQLAVRQGWSSRLREALADERFVVHLQPIVDLRTGEAVYHEALVRMVDERGELLFPAEFLPHAHRTGMIEDIDRSALSQAVALLQAEPALRIFVNLDPRSFHSDVLLDWIEATLQDHRALAGRLGIEITERAPVSDYDRAQRRLARLKSLGCLLAIDDFGTGFSSFEHLRRLPVDLVKVGDGVIDGLGADPVTDAIVEGIIAAAHALSMRVVAEGVETQATATRLREHGVVYAQGFLFGRPRPALERAIA